MHVLSSIFSAFHSVAPPSRDWYMRKRPHTVAYPGIFFRAGGVQQILLRTEDREDGDLGVVAP